MIAARLLGRAEIGLAAVARDELGVALIEGQPEGRLVAAAAHAPAGGLRDRRRAAPASRCASASRRSSRAAGPAALAARGVRRRGRPRAGRRRATPTPTSSIKGARRLPPRGLAALRELHAWRERQAQRDGHAGLPHPRQRGAAAARGGAPDATCDGVSAACRRGSPCAAASCSRRCAGAERAARRGAAGARRARRGRWSPTTCCAACDRLKAWRTRKADGAGARRLRRAAAAADRPGGRRPRRATRGARRGRGPAPLAGRGVRRGAAGGSYDDARAASAVRGHRRARPGRDGQGVPGPRPDARPRRSRSRPSRRPCSTGKETLARFQREARAAARLQHPNIVTIYEIGEVEGTRYIAMELVEGIDLGEAMTPPDRYPLEQKVRMIVDVCRGLDFAHRMGVVHRDVKPANIRVTKDGTVKILDFGIARLGDSRPDAERASCSARRATSRPSCCRARRSTTTPTCGRWA